MSQIQTLINSHKEDWALDLEYYKNPELFTIERERIFFDSWIFIGHESQINKKGDFFIYELLNEEIIIVRGKDMKIRAFFNVCRHRGSRICLEDKGNIKRLTCPYHAWSYNLEGNLQGAKSLPKDIEKQSLSLHKCGLEVIGGMLFVNLSDNPESLDNLKRDLEEPFALFGFENLKIAAHKNYPIEANWKLAVENYQECYHCAPSHPEYSLSHTLKIEGEPGFNKAQERMMSNLEACGLKDIEILSLIHI